MYVDFDCRQRSNDTNSTHPEPEEIPHGDVPDQDASESETASSSGCEDRLTSSVSNDSKASSAATFSPITSSSSASSLDRIRRKYVALCIPARKRFTATGRSYTKLKEIDITEVKYDASFFATAKRAYQDVQGGRGLFWNLFKPTSIEYVQVR